MSIVLFALSVLTLQPLGSNPVQDDAPPIVPKPKLGLVIPNGEGKALLMFVLVSAEGGVLDKIEAEAKRIHCPNVLRKSQSDGVQMMIPFSSEVSVSDATNFLRDLRAAKFGAVKIKDIAAVPAPPEKAPK
ncbi:MAG TPA: hypothetical protein VM662_09300 [Sphingomonas sp.]|nr:hypothetical protein [Sphingomonas sp.]